MNNQNVTTILPCYNHSRYLESRINSILDQTHPVSQIIFMDDASTDDSVMIARELLAKSKCDVDYIINKTNTGSPFVQWNAGVAKAKNNLIWIAETDDTCHPQLLEKLIKEINRTNAVLCFSQSRYINEESDELGSPLDLTNEYWPDYFNSSFEMEGEHFTKTFMSRINVIPNASGVLFSKQAYLAAGSANELMRYCGDWDLWTRLSRQGKVVFVHDELNYFRCHSLTTRAKKYYPKMAAEYFACKINVIFEYPNIDFRCSARRLISQAIRSSSESESVVTEAIRSLKIKSILASANQYRGLNPRVGFTKTAWLVIILFLAAISIRQVLSEFYEFTIKRGETAH